MSTPPQADHERTTPAVPPLTPMAWLRHDLIAARLDDLPASAKVLEVGAGQGAMGVRLAQRFDYTGIEADPESARVASARLQAAGVPHTFHTGSFDELEIAGPHDAVCAFEVLEHLDDDIGALQAWQGLLRPGGRIVLSVPAWQERFGPTDVRVGHVRRYDPDHLESVMRDAGLQDVSVALYGFPLGYLLETGRNMLTRWRPAPSAQQGTAQSGRFLQPGSSRAGTATELLTRPFRALQRRVGTDRWGTGLVALGYRAP